MGFAEDILSAVIAHVTVAFVHQLGHGDSEVVEKVRRLQQLLDRDTTLAGTIRDSASFMNNEVKSNKALAQSLRTFFNSPELHAVARQMFAFSFNPLRSPEVLTSIRLELRSLLSLYLAGQNGVDLDRVTKEVFDAVMKGSERGLRIAIDKGYLAAHEATSAIRHRLILDELSTIKDNLAFLLSKSGPSVAEIEDFERAFRREVGQNHKWIKPPHFDASKKVAIDKLYVPSDFISRGSAREEESAEPITLSLAEFLLRIHRVVVLGSPGGGKSTLVSKLAHDLSLRKATIGGRDLTPMVVSLRQYGVSKEGKGSSIVEFIETVANSDYSVRPPQNAVKHLLLNGRAAVLFDGLDELLDTTRRQRIASDIESFCRAFPSVPVLVTSREIGYLQAPLDETAFETVRLAAFNDDQVQEYVRKWFSVGGEFTAEHQRKRVSSFLQESERVSDLRSVPLLLALMCNIYRGEGYIPKNRPDVYAKCAEMLFERWDRSRGIPVALPFDAHLRPAMMYLAHWLYTSEPAEQTVTERQLVAKATSYLWPARFDDRDKAEGAAKDFVEYCKGRAWVFTDTGLTKEGESLYQFAHRTFLEYFTAQYLVRTLQGVSSLMGVLLPHVKKGEWEVVAQLACQIEDKQKENAGDEILTKLLEEARAGGISERWNLLSFAVRCLEFIVPSPKLMREAAIVLVESTTEYQRSVVSGDAAAQADPLPNEAWQAMADLAAENRQYIIDGLRQNIQGLIESNDETTAYCGWEMVLFLDDYRSVFPEACNFVDLVFADDERLKRNSEKYLIICRHSVGRGKLTVSDMLKLRGIGDLYQGAGHLAFQLRWYGTAEWIADWLLGENGMITPEIKKIAFDNLGELGTLLVDTPTPWLKREQTIGDFRLRQRHRSSKSGVKHQGRALFAAFALAASSLELASVPPVSEISTSDNELLTAFRSTYLARFKPQPSGSVEEELRRSGMNKREIQFALDWSSGKLSLVRKAEAASSPLQPEQSAAL